MRGPHTEWTQPEVETKIKSQIMFPVFLTFSILYLAKACDAISTASCCISSVMSAFLITAFRCSVMVASFRERELCRLVHRNEMKTFLNRLGLQKNNAVKERNFDERHNPPFWPNRAVHDTPTFCDDVERIVILKM